MKIKQSLYKVVGITAGILLVFFSADAFAERQNSLQFSISGGMLTIKDIDKFNDSLSVNGQPTFTDVYGTVGGLFRVRVDRWIIGAEGSMFQSRTKTAGNYAYTLNGGYGLLEFGYDAFKTGGLRVYPLFGVGRSMMTLNIRENTPVEYTALLANPARGAQINKSGMIVNLSLGVDYFFKLTESGGIVLGAQAGYNQMLYASKWGLFGMHNGNNDRNNGMGNMRGGVDGGPNVDLSGFAGHVNVGWAVLF